MASLPRLSRRFNAAKPRACAYLILFAPFLVIPAYPIAIALVMLTVWPFMARRERVVAFMSAVMFAVLAWFAPWIDRYSPIADPASLERWLRSDRAVVGMDL